MSSEVMRSEGSGSGKLSCCLSLCEAGVKGGGWDEAMEDDEEYLEVIIPGGSELPRARELSRETDFSLKPRTYELRDCY